MEQFFELLGQDFLGNPLSRWLMTLGAAVALWVVARLMGSWGRRKLAVRNLEDASLTELPDRILAAIRWYLPAGLAFLLASGWLELRAPWPSILRGFGVIFLGLQVGIFFIAIVNLVIEREAGKRGTKPEALSSFGVIKFLAGLVVWSTVVILVLANLGVNVTGLVASLGVGGIAVALAAQTILSDLFASMSIVLDRPFEVGDFVIVGDEKGKIERIGLKTTRLRSLGGEELIFSNNDLLSSRIRNYGRMEERRIDFSFGLLYSSPADKLREVPPLVRAVVDEQSLARFDRAHFKGFGAFSLDFEVVYYVLSAEYGTYMDVQQAINLGLYERLRKIGLEFAFPTQTLHFDSMPRALYEVAGLGLDARERSTA